MGPAAGLRWNRIRDSAPEAEGGLIMTNFELPTGIGATLRNPVGTYVRVGEGEWMCTEHVLDSLIGPDSQPFTNEEMLGYKGGWKVTTEGVEL
jgi:hypothetical protein